MPKCGILRSLYQHWKSVETALLVEISLVGKVELCQNNAENKLQSLFLKFFLNPVNLVLKFSAGSRSCEIVRIKKCNVKTLLLSFVNNTT